ncbi:MAG: GntR family transcriptional regulator [Blautia sp.]|nr:GntR family transcriptional regulator [Blautia sp.]
MIVLDYQDRRPLYEQIVEKFRILILKNALPPGSRMPSVRQLAMELSINPNTIQRAYMELEQDGLIYPVKGKGNFVAEVDQIRDQSRKLWQEELDTLIKQGTDMDISEEELVELVRESYRKANFYRTKPKEEKA